ncbi:signal transduction histidine kinase [Actinoalloteichus hoggarensis]|uniref:histidine kinase n=1 Tax=Actinoalloteichus hoggarensis TaxID=1470176 RepID=A0A221VYM8_9PSEU|nr:histidine kinase [Actinoalloteichus hoggarensis]ASO18652.1 Signal transduction histidine-protein kinase/phosphatase DegS [Actinoalloteichus hoggarensis]MBB5919883.1 signal transduction histidine kinase [Actinoalloteichus hoggarensis]
MNTDAAPRLGGWQQAWRLTAAAAVGVVFWFSTATQLPAGCTADSCSWFVTGDPLVAVACLIALWWRRRFPIVVAVPVLILASTSTLATGAALLALTSVATRRRPVELGLTGVTYVIASQFALEFYPVQSIPTPLWLQLVLPALGAGIAIALGLAVGARRVEVRSLRERAESAEREQAARAAQARAVERNRIAREMHDGLAHRISLVSMQAGALGRRRDLSAEENDVLIRGIADGAHQALEELRDVLGVLRAGPDGPDSAPLSVDRIPELVSDARAAGLDVTLTGTVPGAPSDVAGRTGFRVVQEGLTNAVKHAPGAHVRIVVEKSAGELLVRVRNSRVTTEAAPPPTSGFGLLGLAERVSLAGGALDHHPTADGGYLLTARLPWSGPASREENPDGERLEADAGRHRRR